MNKNKIIYWISTIIFSFAMLGSGFAYFSNPEVIEGFKHLGFPDYFRKELGIAKILGVIVILIPMVPRRFKEWAYAGFFITFISAFIAHYSVGDDIGKSIAPLIVLAISLVSYFFFDKLHKEKTSV